MEIDNKTKASVLRWLANGHRRKDTFEVGSLLDSADKLDPPEKPIHPHDGCKGMVVDFVVDGNTKRGVYREGDHPSSHIIPREQSKIPAFLCDGTRPEWVKDDDMVWFYAGCHVDEANYIYWSKCNGMHFCVLDPVEVQ